MVISVPVSITASSDRPAAWTSVRISWPRWRRAMTTISPGCASSGMRASSTLMKRFSKSIISRCSTSASMPIMPSPPRSDSRSAEAADCGRCRPERQLGDLDAVDDMAGGHGVEDRGRTERKLQPPSDAQADDGRVGAAVDDEIIGPLPVDEHLDGQARLDLARLQVLAVDGKRRVEIGGRQRRHVGRRIRGGLRTFGFRGDRRPPERRAPDPRATARNSRIRARRRASNRSSR